MQLLSQPLGTPLWTGQKACCFRDQGLTVVRVGSGKRARRPVNKQLQELMSDKDELWDGNNMLGDEDELDFWKRDGQILSLWGGDSRTGA